MQGTSLLFGTVELVVGTEDDELHGCNVWDWFPENINIFRHIRSKGYEEEHGSGGESSR